MSLYAYDEDTSPIFAGDAEERRAYKCCGCHKTVRVRKGPRRIPHFYHLRLTPSCRLYGKSQDHLFAQLALQKILPPGEAILEKPFPGINRVGDLVWESRKIIFEIQCSNIESYETEKRTKDYLGIGYQIVWILDDRIFNRRVARPAEKWMRRNACYYVSIRGRDFPIFYDQFEIFFQHQRVKKGQRLHVQVDRPCYLPDISWDDGMLPQQVLQKTIPQCLYFKGDLLHKALLAGAIPSLAVSMQNLRAIELFYEKELAPTSPLIKILDRLFCQPLAHLLYVLHEINERLD